MKHFQEYGEEHQACGTSTYHDSKQAKSSTIMRSPIDALLLHVINHGVMVHVMVG